MLMSAIIVILPCTLKLYIHTEKCINSIWYQLYPFYLVYMCLWALYDDFVYNFSYDFSGIACVCRLCHECLHLQFLFKFPGKSQHIYTKTLRKLHDNHEITMQSRFGFYDNREEHVRSRWGLCTALAIQNHLSTGYGLTLFVNS